MNLDSEDVLRSMFRFEDQNDFSKVSPHSAQFIRIYPPKKMYQAVLAADAIKPRLSRVYEIELYETSIMFSRLFSFVTMADPSTVLTTTSQQPHTKGQGRPWTDDDDRQFSEEQVLAGLANDIDRQVVQQMFMYANRQLDQYQYIMS